MWNLKCKRHKSFMTMLTWMEPANVFWITLSCLSNNSYPTEHNPLRKIHPTAVEAVLSECFRLTERAKSVFMFSRCLSNTEPSEHTEALCGCVATARNMKRMPPTAIINNYPQHVFLHMVTATTGMCGFSPLLDLHSSVCAQEEGHMDETSAIKVASRFSFQPAS